MKRRFLYPFSAALVTVGLFAQEAPPPPPDTPDPETAAQGPPPQERERRDPRDRGWRRTEQDEARRFRRPDGPPTARQRSYSLPPELTIPAGTFISVTVDQQLSSDRNKTGDVFTATLAQPIIVNGYVVARRGQTVGGRIAETQKAGRIKGTSRLGFELTEISLADGQQFPIISQLMQYDGGTSKGRDATAIGATTGVGAAIGAAASGGSGAAIGAAAGAAASTIGVLMTRGRATEVYPETPVTFRIMEPLTFSTENSQVAFLPAQQSDLSAPSAQPRTLQRRQPNTNIGIGVGGGWGRWGGWGPGWGGWGPGWYGPGMWGPSIYYSPRFHHGHGRFRRW